MRQPFDLKQVLQEQKRQRNKKSLHLIAFLTLVGITILLFNLPDLLGFEDYNSCSDKLAEFCSMLQIVSLFAALASLIWVAYLIRPLLGYEDARHELLERTETNAILQERVEGMPEWKSPIPIEELRRKFRLKKWLVYFLVYILFVLPIQYLIPYFWPDISPELLNMISMMLGVILIGSFPSREEQVRARLQNKESRKQVQEQLQEQKKRADRATQRELEKAPNQLEKRYYEPDSWRSQMLAALAVLVFAAVMIGCSLLMARYVIVLLDWLDEFLGSPTYTIYGILALVSLIFVCFIVSGVLWPMFKLYRPLRQGNYEKALEVVEQMQRPKYWRAYVCATILLFAGQYSKTEQIVRKTLIARQDMATSKEVSLAMEALGAALIAQERYDEAIQVLEGAILVWPKGHESYSTLAEVYLFQGIEAQKALLLAQTAQRHKRRRLSWGLILDRYQFGEAWANQAWSYALQGDHKQANKALKWAFRFAEKGYKPTFAGIHYRAGRTKQLMGDWPTAAQHYRNAYELDPRGHYGHLARLAVRK